MTFDILPLTQAEVDALPTMQQKLLRTAQQKKNELTRKLNQSLGEYKLILLANDALDSSLYSSYSTDLTAEYNEQVEIIKEQLVFNMALREPTNDGETGDSGNDPSGYLVDYELSYMERYIQVKDYYMAIEDPNERLALYAADEVAVKYLASYYNTLYDYLLSFTK